MFAANSLSARSGGAVLASVITGNQTLRLIAFDFGHTLMDERKDAGVHSLLVRASHAGRARRAATSACA